MKLRKNNPNLTILPEIFAQFPDIEAVYLFGSTATAKTHAESDLDIAILPKSSALRPQKLALFTALAQHGFDHVDIVFLDTEDIVLKFEAVRHNKLIYQTDDFDHGSYYSKIVRQHADFAPFLRVQRAAYKRRMLDG